MKIIFFNLLLHIYFLNIFILHFRQAVMIKSETQTDGEWCCPVCIFIYFKITNGLFQNTPNQFQHIPCFFFYTGDFVINTNNFLTHTKYFTIIL